jgi:hypothetical protein
MVFNIMELAPTEVLKKPDVLSLKACLPIAT